MNDNRFDAIILGAGQAGVPLSQTLAEAGWRTLLVEREHVGGTCVNEGCTPSKTMIASARVAYLARRSNDYGVRTGSVGVDMRTVRRRKREIVKNSRTGLHRRIEDSPVELVMGRASFTGPHTVRVHANDGTTRDVSADHIFINVGLRPRIPELEGLQEVPYLTSTTIMELDTVPDHLIVVGGGYVGVEFAQMFRRFGSRVTILQRSGQLLTHEDQDVADEVAHILREDGIDILFNSEPTRVERQEGGGLRMAVDTPGGTQELGFSHLLLATGRVPYTGDLNLAAAGIETDKRGYVQANDRLETNVEGVYALGDVKGGPAFTHTSYDDFRIIRANLLEGGDLTIDHRLLTYVVFMDPQLGRVGLTESQAREQGYEVRVAKLPMRHVARAREMDETRGFMKAVVDGESDRILGAAILGIEGGEIVSVVKVAMMGDLSYTALRDGVFPHPTLSEALNNLFLAMDNTR
jgi:pyruvate/2-oxoglutarate dehydrogenase complex dihydrolipoamide dehydrogenase (E3) component